jgi:tetratricopeptide (TPR) repeat protein
LDYGEGAKAIMSNAQEQYDEAMYDFSIGNMDAAIEKLKTLLSADPSYFDAQLSLGMAYYRKGDYATAIVEGHKAERLAPKEQLVHTNLSLFYLKAGDKTKAEHHGLQARIASWRNDSSTENSNPDAPSLEMAKPAAPSGPPPKFPEMPWKNKTSLTQKPASPGTNKD